jgi:hypothetical protein
MAEPNAHTDASGVIGPQAGDELPWLNSVAEVDSIVNDFTAEVMKRHGEDIEKGVMPSLDRPLLKWLVPECDRLNGLFFGLTDEGYKTGPWNTPEQLGHSLIVNLGLTDEEQRLAVRNAFMAHAGAVVDVINENRALPFEDWIWQVAGLAERLRNALLGIPADLGDEATAALQSEE